MSDKTVINEPSSLFLPLTNSFDLKVCNSLSDTLGKPISITLRGIGHGGKPISILYEGLVAVDEVDNISRF